MATSASSLVVQLRLPRADAAPSAPTSDSSDHSGSSGRPARSSSGGPRRKAKRKSTYDARKDEIERLMEEMESLEAHVEELRAQTGMPSREEVLAVERAQQQTGAMDQAWRAQALAMCGVESLVGTHLRAQPMSPLHTHMRLGRDPVDHLRTLEGVWRQKIDLGVRYLNERFRGVDDHDPFCDQQAWTNDRGDFCFRRAEVVIFEGVQSVKQVFDALLFAFNNMEISVSEKLGQLALREDIESVGSRIYNHRIASSIGHGLELEMNTVCLSDYHVEDGEEVAYSVTDSVEEDELRPYIPSERVRKDVSGAVTMCAFRRPGSEVGDEFGVAMKRCVYLSVLKPEFPITKAARDALRINIASWGDVIVSTMKEYLRVR